MLDIAKIIAKANAILAKQAAEQKIVNSLRDKLKALEQENNALRGVKIFETPKVMANGRQAIKVETDLESFTKEERETAIRQRKEYFERKECRERLKGLWYSQKHIYERDRWIAEKVSGIRAGYEYYR